MTVDHRHLSNIDYLDKREVMRYKTTYCALLRNMDRSQLQRVLIKTYVPEGVILFHGQIHRFFDEFCGFC